MSKHHNCNTQEVHQCNVGIVYILNGMCLGLVSLAVMAQFVLAYAQEIDSDILFSDNYIDYECNKGEPSRPKGGRCRKYKLSLVAGRRILGR